MERTRVRHTGSAVYSEDDFSPARVTRNSLREKQKEKPNSKSRTKSGKNSAPDSSDFQNRERKVSPLYYDEGEFSNKAGTNRTNGKKDIGERGFASDAEGSEKKLSSRDKAALKADTSHRSLKSKTQNKKNDPKKQNRGVKKTGDEKGIAEGFSKPKRKTETRTGERQGNSGTSRATFHIARGITDKTRRKGLVFTAVVAVVIAFFLILNAALPGGIIEATGNSFASFGKSGSFPVKISSRNVVLSQSSSSAVLLGDSTVTMYSESGGVIFERLHGFSSPAMKTSDSRVLLFDRMGHGVRMENAAKTLFTFETEDSIYTGDISKSGAFAIVTEATGYTAQINVYDKNANKKYVWYSAHGRIAAVSLSDNGRFAAVMTVSSSNGDFSSELVLLDTKSTEPIARRQYDQSVPVSVDIKGDRAVAVMSDKMVSLSLKGEEITKDFSGASLIACDNSSSSGTAVVLNRYSDELNNRLLFVDKKLDEYFSSELTLSVESVAVGGNTVSIVSGQSIISFNNKGEQIGGITLGYEPSSLAAHGSKLWFTGVSVLDCESVRRTVQE